MAEQMLSQKEWGRNVGTEGFPVTFLHEYAVGLIWDMLQVRDVEVYLPTINGELSGNVMAGVGKVSIPDSLQPIGGYIPDLALYDGDFRVVRVIEVVVTSKPSDEKVKSLQSRGVEVVVVPVRNEGELCALFPAPVDTRKPQWRHHRVGREGRGAGVNFINYTAAQGAVDKEMNHLLSNLQQCSPEIRRELHTLLQQLGSLESLYPLRPDNPKREALQRD